MEKLLMITGDQIVDLMKITLALSAGVILVIKWFDTRVKIVREKSLGFTLMQKLIDADKEFEIDLKQLKRQAENLGEENAEIKQTIERIQTHYRETLEKAIESMTGGRTRR